MIPALADYLEEQNIGTVGEDIFLGELPLTEADDDNNSACISLVASPSPEPNKSIPYYEQRVDVLARYSDYEDGYAKMQEIFDLLHKQENYDDISGYHIYLSYALGMIEDSERDAERRHIFKLTLGFIYRNASGS